MYLFVAFKPSSKEYVRGCRVGTYSEDFQITNHLTESQLIARWADFLLKNRNLDSQEAPYEFWIFKDGIAVWAEMSAYWDGWEQFKSIPPWQEEEMIDTQEKEEKAIREIYSQSCEFANKQYTIILKEKQLANEAELVRHEAQLKEIRLKQYMELKKEFGNEI